MRIVLAVWLSLGIAVPATAGGVKQKEPGPKAKGKVYEWTAQNGLVYRYHVPKKYDAKRGANLTFILHGSNGNRGWGFANCPAGKFRADDIVVSPDGTTSNGRGGFNSIGRPQDVQRFHELHQALKNAFKVNATFLYGHSQGSFFALHYAGEHPDQVQGVVAFASGVWSQTRIQKKGHAQAIVLLHGMQDPVVPYVGSVGALKAYRDAKYPILHMKSIEGWNHWPTANNSKVPHTQQQLAWCEGMTTSDPDRLRVSFEFLASNKVKMRHDYSATYRLAKYVTEVKFVSEGLKKRAAKAMATIDKLAEAHVAALKNAHKKKFAPEPWVGHLPIFLRSFRGVPACDAFAKKWDRVIETHRDNAVPELRDYYQTRGKDAAAAFASAVKAIESGYLHYECADNRLLKALEDAAKEGKKLGIKRGVLKRYEAIVPAYKKALQEAQKECDGLNRKVGKL